MSMTLDPSRADAPEGFLLPPRAPPTELSGDKPEQETRILGLRALLRAWPMRGARRRELGTDGGANTRFAYGSAQLRERCDSYSFQLAAIYAAQRFRW